LERHTSGVNYNRNKFIIQATGLLASTSPD
jgi:hypothetical protein